MKLSRLQKLSISALCLFMSINYFVGTWWAYQLADQLKATAQFIFAAIFLLAYFYMQAITFEFKEGSA